VYIDNDLPERYRKSISVHESVEKYLVERYGLDPNAEAHEVAEQVEKRWFLENYPMKEWEEYSKIVERIHRKELTGGKASSKLKVIRSGVGEVRLEGEHGFAFGELGDGLFRLDDFQIREAERGKGKGQELYKSVEEKLRELGAETIVLECASWNKGFWDKMGYKVEEYDKSLGKYNMAKVLK
jgi:GNAT superfamily N-acetyltransferase